MDATPARTQPPAHDRSPAPTHPPAPTRPPAPTHPASPQPEPSARQTSSRPLPDALYTPLRAYSLARGLRWSLRQFGARPFPMLVPGILVVIISAIVMTVSHWLTPAQLTLAVHVEAHLWNVDLAYVPPPLDWQTALVFVIGYIVTLTSSLMLQNATLSGSIGIAEGHAATVRRFVVPRNWNVMVNVTTVLCVAIILGLVLFVVPGLIALYFLQFAIIASLADENPTVWGSIRKSVRVVRRFPFASLLTIIVLVGVVALGYAVFYVGVVVTGPIAALFLTYSYFSLERRDIVLIAPQPAAVAAGAASASGASPATSAV